MKFKKKAKNKRDGKKDTEKLTMQQECFCILTFLDNKTSWLIVFVNVYFTAMEERGGMSH